MPPFSIYISVRLYIRGTDVKCQAEYLFGKCSVGKQPRVPRGITAECAENEEGTKGLLTKSPRAIAVKE